MRQLPPTTDPEEWFQRLSPEDRARYASLFEADATLEAAVGIWFRRMEGRAAFAGLVFNTVMGLFTVQSFSPMLAVFAVTGALTARLIVRKNLCPLRGMLVHGLPPMGLGLVQCVWFHFTSPAQVLGSMTFFFGSWLFYLLFGFLCATWWEHCEFHRRTDCAGAKKDAHP